MNIRSDTHPISLLPSRLAWLRLNRFLGWALVAAPVVEFFAKLSWANSMGLNLVVILVHGALSLVLFGVPKVKGRRFQVSMHVFGGRPTALSERNRFLLSGYRIALGMIPLLLDLPWLPWFAILPFLYPIMRLPFTVLQHMYVGIGYAFKRWGWAGAPAEAVVFLYVMFFFTHFFNSL